MMTKSGYVYFMTNHLNTVIYIGVTSNLSQRVEQHKRHIFAGFTARYHCEKLVYFEEYSDIESAIKREKQLKNWRREWKEELINKMNPEWKDLAK